MEDAETTDKKELAVKCEVCAANTFKYKCPRCEVQTCSLPCVLIHKKELECSGKRDSTAFVPIGKFTNLNLLSDYRLLEGIDRAVTNCRRNPQRWFTRHDQPLPRHLFRLKKAAGRRRIRLQFLPQHFTRHKKNESKLNFETQEISWKLDFIFPQGDMIKISDVVNEKTRLSAAIDKFLDPVQCPDIYKNYLKFYHSSGTADVIALLKAERSGNPKAVYMLDLFSDITSNLENRVIIENPVILIIKKAYKDEYVILEDDEEISHESRGNKSGFFGDFSPVTFFDKLDKKPRQKSEGDTALDSIRESTRELRGRPKEEDSDSDEHVPQPKRAQLNIPSYERLCSL